MSQIHIITVGTGSYRDFNSIMKKILVLKIDYYQNFHQKN